MEIDERDKFQDLFTDKISFSQSEKFRGTKSYFLYNGDLLWEMLHLLAIRNFKKID